MKQNLSSTSIIICPHNQQELPTISFEHSKALPFSDDALPFQLRGRIWALHNHPHLPFMLFSPFRVPWCDDFDFYAVRRSHVFDTVTFLRLCQHYYSSND